ncbi:hypothetical protein JCM11491_004023 [Sporobolomyces phaffii]
MRTTALWYLATLVSAGLASTIPAPAQVPFEMIEASTLPSLPSLLTRSKNSRLFYDYVRESTSISTRLADPLEVTTIIAPLNSAIMALERRPHEGAFVADHDVTYALGSREDEQARAEYLESWIKRHLISGRVDLDDPTKVYQTLHGGSAVSFVRGEGPNVYKVVPVQYS